LQVLKAIRFELHDRVEIVFGKGLEINRAVIARIRVGLRAGDFQHGIALFLAVVRAATKHQMFKKVRETGLSGFDFVARAGLHDDVESDQIRIFGRDRNKT
jgi:hypothetical protein